MHALEDTFQKLKEISIQVGFDHKITQNEIPKMYKEAA